MYFPGGSGPGKPEAGRRPAVAAPTRWLSMARPDSSGGGGPCTDRGGPKSRPSILRAGAAASPPPGPAGLAQRDLKVRPRRSPKVPGRRGLRGVHGGGQRGPRPAAGTVRAARRSSARRRTQRLARRGSRLRAPATATPAPGAARRPCCPPSRGRRSPAPPAAASHFLPAFPFFGRKPLPGPSARRANSSALPRPGSRSPRKSQLSSRRAPRFLIKSR